MSTIKVNSIEPANAGSEDYFLARAWVNLDGSGTISINNDGNVSSVTDNGVGNYQANLTNALASANAVVCGTRVFGAVSEDRQGISCGVITTTSFTFGGGHGQSNGAFEDGTYTAAVIL